MRQQLVTLLAIVSIGVHSDDLTCPAYADIAQPSVSGQNFTIDEFGGHWYVVGTSEPTIPSFCKCPFIDVNVDKDAGEYAYKNTVSCLGQKMSLDIKGKLSEDPNWPGELQENAAVFNHIIGPLAPDYIFNVKRDSNVDGNPVKFAMAYACIGKFPPVVGPELFSLNILARSTNNTETELAELLQEAGDLTNGLIKMTGMRFTDKDTFEKCGIDSLIPK